MQENIKKEGKYHQILIWGVAALVIVLCIVGVYKWNIKRIETDIVGEWRVQEGVFGAPVSSMEYYKVRVSKNKLVLIDENGCEFTYERKPETTYTTHTIEVYGTE